MNWNELTCTDREGNTQTYYYQIEYPSEYESKEWHFRVSIEAKLLDNWFEATVKPLNKNSVCLSSIQHNYDNNYSAKGIPDALLPRIVEELNMNLFSSIKFSDNGEFRTDDAEKMWRRLVSNGVAEYDNSKNRYCISMSPTN